MQGEKILFMSCFLRTCTVANDEAQIHREKFRHEKPHEQ